MTTIFRQWSGWARLDKAADYPTHFNTNVVPELESVSGFMGASLLKREHGNVVQYTVISRWKSMGAIKAFAGDDPSQAVVEPQAVAALARYENNVTHYEVVSTVEQRNL